MFQSNQILIFNIIGWAITLYVFYKKRKSVDSAVFLISTFVLYAVCSLLTYNFEYSSFHGKELSIWPLFYLYIILLYTLSPVLRFNVKKVREFPHPPYGILDLMSWIFVICMIIKLPSEITHLQSGLTAIMADQGSDVYSEGMAHSRTSGGAYSLTSLPSIYVNITMEVMFLIAFYNLLKKRQIKLTITLFICFAIMPLGSIANGQRGGTFDVLIMILGTYFLFAPILESKIRGIVNKIGILVIFLLLIPIVALTNSRFGDREGSSEQSVYSYMGQQNLNFDIYAFDNNGLRNGDRVFPLFKKMLGFENVPNDFWERRKKYPHLKINDEVFIGYVGDFLLDFGPVVSTLLFILFTSIFLKLTKVKDKRCPFYKLLGIQFVLTLGLQGGLKLYPFADTFALKIFIFGLLYIYLVLNKNSINRIYRQLSMPSKFLNNG